MQVIPLGDVETNPLGASHLAIISYTDLNTTAGLTKTLNIFPETGTNPVGYLYQVVAFRVKTAFSGVTTLTLQVGDTGSGNRYLTTALGDMLTAAYVAVPASVTTQPFSPTSADNLKGLFTATVSNLTSLTVGEVAVWFKAIKLSDQY